MTPKTYDRREQWARSTARQIAMSMAECLSEGRPVEHAIARAEAWLLGKGVGEPPEQSQADHPGLLREGHLPQGETRAHCGSGARESGIETRSPTSSSLRRPPVVRRPDQELREAARNFLVATEALCDWLNDRDISADHKDSQPEDFRRLCDTMEALRLALSGTTKEGDPRNEPMDLAALVAETAGDVQRDRGGPVRVPLVDPPLVSADAAVAIPAVSGEPQRGIPRAAGEGPHQIERIATVLRDDGGFDDSADGLAKVLYDAGIRVAEGIPPQRAPTSEGPPTAEELSRPAYGYFIPGLAGWGALPAVGSEGPLPHSPPDRVEIERLVLAYGDAVANLVEREENDDTRAEIAEERECADTAEAALLAAIFWGLPSVSDPEK